MAHGEKPKGGYSMVEALALLVGAPLVIAIAAGYVCAGSFGTGAGVLTFILTWLVGAVVALCALPAVAKHSKAPGWPEFERTFGDSPLWWLGRRR